MGEWLLQVDRENFFSRQGGTHTAHVLVPSPFLSFFSPFQSTMSGLPWNNFLATRGIGSTPGSEQWKALNSSERLEFAFPDDTRKGKSKRRRRHRSVIDKADSPVETSPPPIVHVNDADDAADAAVSLSPSGSIVQNSSVVTHSDKKPNPFAGIVLNFGPPGALMRKPYQVPQEDFEAFQAWRKMHPVLPIELPSSEQDALWITITTTNNQQQQQQQQQPTKAPSVAAGVAPRNNSVGLGVASEHAQPKTNQEDQGLSVHVPRRMTISDQVYTLMTLFPGSKDRRYFAGAFGVVVAYQATASDKIVVLKASVMNAEDKENLEQEAYEVLEYLDQSEHMSQSCHQQFVHLVAGTVAIVGSSITQQRQAFVVLERMDATLEGLLQDQPHLFVYASAIRHILKSIVDGLVCMHSTKPKPIAHGDLKPANLLCSPYTDAWIGVIQDEKDEEESKKGDALPPQVLIRIADFDASYTSVWDLTREPELRGTAGVMSPQRLQKALYRTVIAGSTQDDIWALGMVILQLCATDAADHIFSFFEQTLRKNSREGLSEAIKQRLQAYIDTQMRLVATQWRATWTHNSQKTNDIKALVDLVRQCLSIEPDDRPTIVAIQGHSFFQEK
jgi:serine/threonine protein kinase